jgi:hypothetical protein
MLVCHSDSGIMRAPRVHTARMPAGYEIFPSNQLTPGERRSILDRQRESPFYPEILGPFTEENIISDVNSVGLRFGDQVVGWVIAHRILPDTTRFTRMFVHGEHRRLGRTTIALLAASIRMICTSRLVETAPYAMWDASFDNTQMMQFVNRHLAPWMTKSQTTWGSVREL